MKSVTQATAHTCKYKDTQWEHSSQSETVKTAEWLYYGLEIR